MHSLPSRSSHRMERERSPGETLDDEIDAILRQPEKGLDLALVEKQEVRNGVGRRAERAELAVGRHDKPPVRDRSGKLC